MAKVDGTLGSLIQGVSQQPSRARIPGQSQEQINVSNDEVFGMSRRHPTNKVAAFDATAVDTNTNRELEHGWVSDGEDRRLFWIGRTGEDPDLRLIEGGHTERTLTLSGSSAAYLAGTYGDIGRDRYRLAEVDGRIVVVNTEKTPAMLSGAPAGQSTDATMIFCLGGQYNTGYRITVTTTDGVVDVIYSTPDGDASGEADNIVNKYIMARLYRIIQNTDSPTPSVPTLDPDWIPNHDASQGTGYITSGGSAAILLNYDVYLINEVLMFVPKNATGIAGTVEAIDMAGNDSIVSVRKETSDVGKLPLRAPVGHTVTVKGSDKSEDDYYLQWVVEGETAGTRPDIEGVWEECSHPDEDYQIDPATMPHEIVRDGVNYTMQPIAFDDRSAGDDLSNPQPQFIGSQIRDVVSFANRTVFIHDRQVSMSQTDEFNNWFKKTGTAGLDTDPINLRSTSTKGNSRLQYIVPFNRDLVVFGTDNAQFVINGRVSITPETASMVLTTEFDADLTSRPVVAGNNILFSSYTGEFSKVHEMYLKGDQDNHDRRNVSTHVPNYIVGRTDVLTSADGSSMLFLVADDKRVVYIWEYLWIDDQRVQNAWSKWTFSRDVVSIDEQGGTVTVVMQDTNMAYFVMDATLDRNNDDGFSYEVHGDYKQEVVLSDSAAINVEIPADVADVRVVAKTGTFAGHPLATTSVTVDGTTGAGEPPAVDITLTEAYTGTVLVCVDYLTRFVPTRPYIRDTDGVAVSSGALTISDFQITYTDSGPFTAIRESLYVDSGEYWSLKHTGVILDDPNYTIGDVPISSGLLHFPFDDDTKYSTLAIECDGPFPLSLTEIEWKGNRRQRSRRIATGGRQ